MGVGRLGGRLRGSAAVSSWLSGAGVRIRSIQRGTISIASASSATATITSVDVNNSELVYLGNDFDTDSSTNEELYECRLELTNATTITATRGNTSGAAAVVSYEVIEYYPGVIRSAQRGVIVVSGVASNTATVSAVNTQKSRLSYLGSSSDGDTAGFGARFRARIVLTNATTITATRGTTNQTARVSYQLLEFY